MSKYNDLIKIVDKLRMKAPLNYKRYHPEVNDIPALEKAMARSFIHLFLKVKFGIINFNDRENYNG